MPPRPVLAERHTYEKRQHKQNNRIETSFGKYRDLRRIATRCELDQVSLLSHSCHKVTFWFERPMS
jgi:hypothetical protein